jgi:acyl dehydratase
MMHRLETFFDDVQEGDQGPDWSTPAPMSRTDFVRYAGASGDFNPMHHDDEFARAVGYPSVFGHGMLTAGVLSHYLTDWLGIGNLRTFRSRFKGQVFPGDKLSFQANVTRKYTEGDESRIDCDLAVTNQNGEVVLTGAASAALPQRG